MNSQSYSFRSQSPIHPFPLQHSPGVKKYGICILQLTKINFEKLLVCYCKNNNLIGKFKRIMY
jgi:hypothetical protein